MGLQYRSDTDRLLYHDTGGNKLMNECCCPEGPSAPNQNIRYELCCDDVPYDDLPDTPHYIVISASNSASIGYPACVVYNDCCYCGNTASSKSTNVVFAGNVNASTESNCASCNTVDGDDCDWCNICNNCDPPLKNEYTITISVTTNPDEWSTPAVAAAAQSEINGTWKFLRNTDPGYECRYGIPGSIMSGLTYWQSVSGSWYTFFSPDRWQFSMLGRAGYATGPYGSFVRYPDDLSQPDTPCALGAFSYYTPTYDTQLEGGTIVIS